jgi:hypothetical protein
MLTNLPNFLEKEEELLDLEDIPEEQASDFLEPYPKKPQTEFKMDKNGNMPSDWFRYCMKMLSFPREDIDEPKERFRFKIYVPEPIINEVMKSDTNKKPSISHKKETIASNKNQIDTKKKEKMESDLNSVVSKSKLCSQIMKTSRSKMDYEVFLDMFIYLDNVMRKLSYYGLAGMEAYSDPENIIPLFETIEKAKSSGEGKIKALQKLYRFLHTKSEYLTISAKIQEEECFMKDELSDLVKIVLKHLDEFDSERIENWKDCFEKVKTEETNYIMKNSESPYFEIKLPSELKNPEECGVKENILIYKFKDTDQYSEVTSPLINRYKSLNFLIADLVFEMNNNDKFIIPIEDEYMFVRDEGIETDQILYEIFQDIQKKYFFSDTTKDFLFGKEKMLDAEKSLYIYISKNFKSLCIRLNDMFYTKNQNKEKMIINQISLYLFSNNEPCQHCSLLLGHPWNNLVEDFQKILTNTQFNTNKIVKYYAHSSFYHNVEHVELEDQENPDDCCLHVNDYKIHWFSPALISRLLNKEYSFTKTCRTLFANRVKKIEDREIPENEDGLIAYSKMIIENFNKHWGRSKPEWERYISKQFLPNFVHLIEKYEKLIEKNIALYNDDMSFNNDYTIIFLTEQNKSINIPSERFGIIKKEGNSYSYLNLWTEKIPQELNAYEVNNISPKEINGIIKCICHDNTIRRRRERIITLLDEYDFPLILALDFLMLEGGFCLADINSCKKNIPAIINNSENDWKKIKEQIINLTSKK